ncbi:hypothetical protein AB3S75_010090 [Citrus x aurantiifolia]
METSFTINGIWKICISVSFFLGCIIFVLSLNSGRSNISLFTVRSVAISVTPSTGFATLIKSDNPVEEEKLCNIFNGKWVYNGEASPLYNEAQCPFLSDQVSCQRNGRPDVEYEKWTWKAEGCEIPRFNATDMLERLKNKRVIIVGDSLNRNQWESLACLLYTAIPPSRVHVNVQNGVYKVLRALDYDCSVEFYWSPFLVQLDASNALGSRILRLDELSASAQKWKGADVMVFNTGHWWVHRGKIKAWELFEHDGKLMENLNVDEAFEIAMETWAHWIDENVDATKTIVFFRSISPEHKGEQWCYNTTEPITDESYVAKFPKSMVEIVKRTIGGMSTPVKYLNITKLSQYRVDAHPTIYTKKREFLIAKQQMQLETYADCSHWCLPGLPDTWNTLLYASMVLSNPSDISNSSHLLFDVSF